jgi:hypothetical protein
VTGRILGNSRRLFCDEGNILKDLPARQGTLSNVYRQVQFRVIACPAIARRARKQACTLSGFPPKAAGMTSRSYGEFILWSCARQSLAVLYQYDRPLRFVKANRLDSQQEILDGSLVSKRSVRKPPAADKNRNQPCAMMSITCSRKAVIWHIKSLYILNWTPTSFSTTSSGNTSNNL